MKKLALEFDLITLGVFLSIITAAIIGYLRGNTEFFFYAILLLAFVSGIFYFHKKLHLGLGLFVGIVGLIAIHLLGGFLYIDGTRLYDTVFTFFRYDNIAHAYGSVIFTIVAYNALRPYLDREIKHQPLKLAVLMILIIMGFGAVNETIEFIGVMEFNAADGVGDYYNNMLDLLFNFIGAGIGTILIVYYHMIKVVKRKRLKGR